MAFIVELGVCRDPKNKISKTMTGAVKYSCTVKRHVQVIPTGGVVPMEGINVISPQIILHGNNDVLKKNYAYIPDFGRYYFVHNVEIAPNKMYTLSLVEDVLMSFKDEILQCEVELARSADFRNYYLTDDRLPVTQRSLTWNKAFDKTPFTERKLDAIVTFIGPSTPTSPVNVAETNKEVSENA